MLAVVVLGVVAQPAETGPKSADDAVEIAFEGTCTEHEAGFMTAFDVDLLGDRVVGLFGTAMDERILAIFTSPGEGFKRLSKGVDGFSVAGERLLAWSFDPGKLLLLRAEEPGSPRVLWQGSVVPAARPRLTDDRVWWLTEHEEELRAAWSDPTVRGSGPSPARLSPPLPVTEGFALVFSEGAALLQTTNRERSWVWRGKADWVPVEIDSGLEIVGASGAFFVAWDVAASEWLVAEDSRAGLKWLLLFRPASGPAPRTGKSRFYAAADGVRATLVELEGPSAIRMVHLGLGREARGVSVGDVAELAWAAFDGHSLAVLRHRHGRLELELCGRRPRTPVRAEVSEVPAAAQPPPAEPKRRAPLRSAGLSPAGTRALAWMHTRVGPMLELENGKQGRLIDSYEDDQKAGWVYDASLAVIVFSSSGRQDLARQILVGLESLQHPDGSWSFAFHPDKGRAIESNRYVGSIAWVVMAANFYEWQTRDGSFSEMARAGLRFIERFQSKDPSASEFGGVAMGPGRKDEFSAEHNADSYSAFLWRGRLEKDGGLMRTAGQIRRFVLATLWSVYPDGQGGRYFKVGARDGSLYLDPQTWSTLSLGVGADEPSAQKLSEGLRLAERYLEVRHGSLVGFNEAQGPDIGSKIWPEGTEGMVAALRVVGQHDKAAFYHRETAKLQTSSGGIPYATQNSDGWSTKPAVASTAWFLLNEYGRNPFHPSERTQPKAARAGAAGGDDQAR